MRKGEAPLKPNLAAADVRLALPLRTAAYFQLLSYGRHLGLQRIEQGDFWVARTRTKAGGYRRKRLGSVAKVLPTKGDELTYEEAFAAAKSWFARSTIRAHAAEERPIGGQQHLTFSAIGDVFTVGHALHDYVEWKRIAAAKSHFQTSLSLINHHIAPRLPSLPLAGFNGEILRKFVRDVLETPPKRGNQKLGPRRSIEALDAEALRKRKKTVNTLIGILRVAFQMAWENGKYESDRAWRCLRRVPAVDRPRILHLSRNECRQLLDRCRPDVARLVLAALYTGCRATELLQMRCSQVGRDGYGVYILPLKNYRPRFVFLPDEGMIWFLSLIKGRKPNDLVFLRDSGKPWFGNYKHLFKAAVREAELPEEFTFHGLRHTYASQLIQAGATIFAVAQQLGHADPTTVLRTYGHLSPQIRESEVRQRFTTLSPANRKASEEQRDQLTEWRSALHGSDWRSYAQINDIRDPENSPAHTQATGLISMAGANRQRG